jgi:hypothetical protein
MFYWFLIRSIEFKYNPVTVKCRKNLIESIKLLNGCCKNKTILKCYYYNKYKKSIELNLNAIIRISNKLKL